MKDVLMTFRVEPELRAAFTKAADAQHRPAAQVLRELMRSFVAEAQTREAQATAARLSVADRQRREGAVAFARASVGLEGFMPSAEDEALARSFIDGEIELSDFVRVNPQDVRKG